MRLQVRLILLNTRKSIADVITIVAIFTICFRRIYWRMKYGNKKIVYNGETFDSKKEYNRWLELKLLERSGKITDLKRQVKYVLIPAQREPDIIGKRGGRKPGKLIENECAYIADFVYWDNELDKQVVEDTKGFRTKDYIIKRKLMLHTHGIRIVEV